MSEALEVVTASVLSAIVPVIGVLVAMHLATSRIEHAVVASFTSVFVFIILLEIYPRLTTDNDP